MDTILDTADKLVAEILNSDIYKTYLKTKEEISKDTKLGAEVQKFKQAQLEFEIKTIRNIQPSFAEEQYVSKLYSDLMLNPVANDFLNSEKKLLELVKSVSDKITDALDIDIGF